MDKNLNSVPSHTPKYKFLSEDILSFVKFVLKDQLNFFILGSIILCFIIITKLTALFTTDLATYQTGNPLIAVIIAFINLLAFMLSFILLCNTYSIIISDIHKKTRYLILLVSGLSAAANLLLMKFCLSNFIQNLQNSKGIKVNLLFTLKGLFINQCVIRFAYSNIFYWLFWISGLVFFATIISFSIPKATENIE